MKHLHGHSLAACFALTFVVGCAPEEPEGKGPGLSTILVGNSGSAGATSAGAAGAAGTEAAGSSGKAGAAGNEASSGNGGVAGASGTAGSSGSGTAGVAGGGAAGSSGSSGTAGSSGFSGTAGASGASGSAGTAGSSGSAGTGGAPECQGDILGCFSDQPKICLDSKWTETGGVCNWGCGSGQCLCDAKDHFDFFTPFPSYKDKVTGLNWILRAPKAGLDMTWAKASCGVGSRMPTKDEVLGILAQQAPATGCKATENLPQIFHWDLKQYLGGSDFPTAESLFGQPVWTSDTEGGLQVTVQLNTGKVGTRDPSVKVNAIAFCVATK